MLNKCGKMKLEKRKLHSYPQSLLGHLPHGNSSV